MTCPALSKLGVSTTSDSVRSVDSARSSGQAMMSNDPSSVADSVAMVAVMQWHTRLSDSMGGGGVF